MISIHVKCPESASPETGMKSVVARNWEEGGTGSDCLMGTGFPFGVMGKFWH